MIHNFHFLQSDMVFGIINSFREILMPFPERKVARLQCFSRQITLNSGQSSFFRLLNPDWSIQISGAAAVCKASQTLRKSKEAAARLFTSAHCYATHYLQQNR